MNKPCNTCVNRGWTTFAEVAACNCCEAPDYEFFLSDSEQSEIEVQNEHTPDESIRRIGTLRGERENPEPLTLAQLLEMDGEPVWIRQFPHGFQCAIVRVDLLVFAQEPSIGIRDALRVTDIFARKPSGEGAHQPSSSSASKSSQLPDR